MTMRWGGWKATAAGAGLLAAALVPAGARAQELYTPRSIAQTYREGTRSRDGRPGPRYWQNHGRYAITLTASPPDRTIRGTEQITYFNNSPDTLKSLVFKLFVNIHRPGAPRAYGASADYQTPGVQVQRIAVDGTTGQWKDSEGHPTWRQVELPHPLLPHDSTRISLDWSYEISREAGREGMLDSTTYYLAYFYPRVAVYDDYNGWDKMDFTDLQEFYSDFNDYDVTVRVPASFAVWGTGTLQNPQAVLQPDALRRYTASLTADTTIRVAGSADLAAGRVTAQGTVNEWHFSARNVPDMAFAVSNHYDWDAASVVVDAATGRRASVQAAYNDTAADFHHMVQFGRHALGWFSRNWPGVPYPYEKSTIVQGTADMEYPMMVNDNTQSDTTFSRFVAEHEIAHTYFPFYMGINETRYPFMDEGWATALEYLIGVSDMGKPRADAFFKEFRVETWANDPSPDEDLPIVTPGDVLKGAGYGNNAYGKAALGYLAVKDLLGDDAFRRALHAYMDRWHGRHPIPWDFFNTFNDTAGQNLNWFWNAWYFSNNYVDFAVQAVGRSGTDLSVSVQNVGGMPSPFDLRVSFADGTSTVAHQTPAVWRANLRQAVVHLTVSKPVAAVEIDSGIWMDANPSDNRWTQR